MADMYIVQFSGLVSEDNQILSIVVSSLIFFSLHLQIFDGNCDHFTPVVNILEHGITARYVRFYPLTYNYVCMRVEVYGCESWLPWLLTVNNRVTKQPYHFFLSFNILDILSNTKIKVYVFSHFFLFFCSISVLDRLRFFIYHFNDNANTPDT